MLDGQITLNSDWPDFNAILIFIAGGLAVGALVAIVWMFFKIRALSGAILLLQQGKSVAALSTQLPSFIYGSVDKSTSDESYLNFDITIQWDHALFILNILILVTSFIILFRVYRICHSHIPWLCVEIMTNNECLLVPVMRLPLCSTQCHVQVPKAITNLNCYGNWFSPIFKVQWPDFCIFNNVTGQRMLVPETVKLSIFQYFQLKR